MSYTLFIFHRDLRIHDNRSLEYAASLGKPVLPLFVFTPKQVGRAAPIKSLNSIQFMLESLKELAATIQDRSGRLIFLYGDTAQEIEGLFKKLGNPAAVVETKDYTPFAKLRSASMKSLCDEKAVDYYEVDDIYLLPPGTVKNGQGKTFQKFTPFYEKARLKRIEPPQGIPSGLTFLKIGAGLTLASVKKQILKESNPLIHVKGGRKEGITLLKKLPSTYHETHDIPSVPTSNLSAHHHFGTISIRETLAAAKTMPAAARDPFIRQLFWRDFYGNIMADFHGLYGMEATEFQDKGWDLGEKKRKAFQDWKAGTTGLEMVDAGMTQLNRSGYMHNRVRLICSSYLVKDVGVHWRLGERYFAEKLVDYDITQNMMNWIWIASELPFASAPFRRHDPEVGAERFDEEGVYRNFWLHNKNGKSQ